MKRVLFLDARNSVRSPMAEAWFNHLAGGWARAYSRGTMPSFKIDPLAVKVMKEAGVSLTSYVPRIVNQQSITQADVVILMGKDVSPRAFSPKVVWSFQDPTGEPISHYRQLRDAIRLNVLKLIVEMHRTGAEPAAAESKLAVQL